MTKSKKRNAQLPAPPPTHSLPHSAGSLIANARNDITIPYFNGILVPADDTLVQRGGGKGLKIYDEIERDTHAYAMLQKRKKTLIAREWEVRAASDAPRDVEAADLVRELLVRLPFDRICEDLLDATLKGFAVSEIVWGRDGARIIPTRIVSHDQRRFVFDHDWRPRLLTMTKMMLGEELPERKFITHRFGVKGNNPYGLGMGTRLFWPVLFKREGIAFWLHFLEKFAGPTVVGKTPYTNITAEQRRLLETLRSVRTSSAVTVPIGTDIEFLEASRSGTVTYQDFLTYWDKQISICVTGETLTTDVGKAGSRAASETHAEMLGLAVDADADLLSDTLRETLCQWIVDFNMPGAGAPSIWRLRPQNEIEAARARQAKSSAAKVALDALKAVLVAAARIEDDAIAREFIVESGAADHLSDPTLDYLVQERAHLAGADRQELRGIPTGAPRKALPSFADNGSKKKRHEHVCFAEPDGPVERITETLLARTASHFERRLRDIRRAIDAPSYAAASRRMLELAAKWAPDGLAHQIRLAMELAALEGREAVFRELDGETSFAASPFGIEFEEQVEFLRQKRAQPTEVWTDVMHYDHDRAFVIAGAQDMRMLQEFHDAMLAASKTNDIAEFGREFDRIAEAYGWSYNGGRDWRVRTIFATNMRTSYMAGRLRQMRDPDVVRLRPYWMYAHGETREPRVPRELHLDWDGLVLMHDDPWWDVYFPPNGWGCSCGVRTLSRRDLNRMGKSGPDPSPEVVLIPVTVGRGGPTVMYPEGADYGFGYQPGDHWARGLVPAPGDDDPGSEPSSAPPATPSHIPALRDDRARSLDELIENARPFERPLMADGLTPEEYVQAFLDEFDTVIGEPVPFVDKAGARIPISEALFQRDDGQWKVGKRDRRLFMRRYAEAIKDPDEIWLSLKYRRGHENPFLTRRYIRVDPDTGILAVFDLGEKYWWSEWRETTSFKADDLKYLDAQRWGELVYERRRPR